ncbi:MAG: lysophospholipid acyltransferase family protein [Candidatus Omnitrophica bacterium]|nr:lysophospholipid acyltransferase family protein [Candidatus Omnitrophota bacterium]
MFFYILYRFGYMLANILPLRVAYSLAERFSDMHFYIAAKDRKAVAENLSAVLKKDINECYALARNVFRNFGLYMVDFFRLVRLDKNAIEKRVRFIGLENIDKSLELNRGAILISGHIGNWEMGGVAVAMKGYDISCVALNHKHKNINDFFIRQREDKGMKVITMSSTMKRCVTTLSNNGLLALVGDRDFANTGIILDFFGVPASIPKGPAMLSLKMNSPIVPTFFIRENRFNYKMIFEKPLEIKETPGMGKDEVLKEMTKEMVRVIEKYVREYPEQWLVFRRFWEIPADAFVL